MKHAGLASPLRVFFGLQPAHQASRRDPIVALQGKEAPATQWKHEVRAPAQGEGIQRMNSHIAAALATLAFLAPLAPVAHANHDSNPHKGAIERIVRDYLLGNPEVIEEAIDVLRAKGRAEEQKRAEGTIAENGERLRAHPMSPISGNAQGDVTVVEFFAYRCGFCKQALPTMEALPGEDADVRVVWKEFPILGPVSVFAVAAGLDPERWRRGSAGTWTTRPSRPVSTRPRRWLARSASPARRPSWSAPLWFQASSMPRA